MTREYTYGPFNSRRLGLSLGVNILPLDKELLIFIIYWLYKGFSYIN